MKVSKNSVAVAVGLYDTAVGLWPLLYPASFITVAQNENALPPAKVIGSMWAMLGIALLFCSSNRKIIPLLGVASTVAGSTLALAQVRLISNKKLPKAFLLQAAAETFIGATWMISLSTDRD